MYVIETIYLITNNNINNENSYNHVYNLFLYFIKILRIIVSMSDQNILIYCIFIHC